MTNLTHQATRSRNAFLLAAPAVIERVKDSPFHWTDAAIGLASGLAIALVLLGVTLVLRELTRSPRPVRKPPNRRDQP